MDMEFEKEIQGKGLTAPRITPADIEANIVSEFYFTAKDGVDGADLEEIRSANPEEPFHFAPKNEDPDLSVTPIFPLKLLTFCVLVLKNGFTVTGESACASPENFDPEIGRKIARKNAVEKIWPLLGYELRTKLAAQ